MGEEFSIYQNEVHSISNMESITKISRSNTGDEMLFSTLKYMKNYFSQEKNQKDTKYCLRLPQDCKLLQAEKLLLKSSCAALGSKNRYTHTKLKTKKD